MAYQFLEGEVILIDKPYKWTSFDIVDKIKKTIRNYTDIDNIKIGHAGTLDPHATGLLIVCTGRFTKRIEEFQCQEKEYTGTMKLGATTPSYDTETATDNHFSTDNVSHDDIYAATKKFVGEISQIPPIYSAKKIKGKKAYEYARKGKEVTIRPQLVTIKEFSITGINLPDIDFKIVCSKGTYIRSLVHDFGKALNNGAHLHSLCRTRIGNHTLDDAVKIEEFERNIINNYNNQQRNKVLDY